MGLSQSESAQQLLGINASQAAFFGAIDLHDDTVLNNDVYRAKAEATQGVAYLLQLGLAIVLAGAVAGRIRFGCGHRVVPTRSLKFDGHGGGYFLAAVRLIQTPLQIT
jgi:hypothetical protein